MRAETPHRAADRLLPWDSLPWQRQAEGQPYREPDRVPSSMWVIRANWIPTRCPHKSTKPMTATATRAAARGPTKRQGARPPSPGPPRGKGPRKGRRAVRRSDAHREFPLSILGLRLHGRSAPSCPIGPPVTPQPAPQAGQGNPRKRNPNQDPGECGEQADHYAVGSHAVFPFGRSSSESAQDWHRPLSMRHPIRESARSRPAAGRSGPSRNGWRRWFPSTVLILHDPATGR